MPSQCQDPRHAEPHRLPCVCCTEHCDPQEWVETEEDQAMTTLLEKYNTMLDALRQVVELCDDGDADELTQEAAHIAKEAIAKAEGN